ncbi:hypothetical protein HHI36_022048 [Cryptolaemus montrouzieri]|uniref:Uncharacterized protein n=1 Tax=Cryptolaemus montrouzieri TaxID=559131 RepID=A0ABD2MYK6_9CUCU
MIYEDYLEKTTRNFGKQETVYNLLCRYQNLLSKQGYSTEMNVKKNELLKTLQQREIDIIKGHFVVVLELKNQLSKHLVQYDNTRRQTCHLESLITSIWSICNNKLEDLILSVQAINNLSESMYRRQMEHNITLDVSRDFHKIGNIPIIRNAITIKKTMKAVENISKKVETRMKVIRKLWGTDKIVAPNL